MEILRKKGIPSIFSKLDFVREGNGLFADCPEDMENVVKFQRIASGKDCVSVLDSVWYLTIKCEFPDDLLDLTGRTGEPVRWKHYYLKTYDVEKLIEPHSVGGSVSLIEAGIDPSFLRSLTDGSSCINILLETERFFTGPNRKGYELTEAMQYQITQIEGKMIDQTP